MFNKHDHTEVESMMTNTTDSCVCPNHQDDMQQIIISVIMNIVCAYCWLLTIYYVCQINRKYNDLEQENGDIIEDVAMSKLKMTGIVNDSDRIQKDLHEFVYDMDESMHRVKRKMKSMERKVKKIKKSHKRE